MGAMAASRTTPKTSAAEVWRLLMGCAMSRFGLTASIAQDLGLTPGHVKALLVLDPDEPQTMGALAQSFSCDASTMTWLVDRLEERGLVERRNSPNDRRVKTVALTERGVETKNELEAKMYKPPEAIESLDADVLATLRRVFENVSA
jgi:DNA-binding MarR family transcriptional regulator